MPLSTSLSALDPRTGRHRWVAVGTSSSSDGATAGREAAGTSIGGVDPRLFIVFASHRYDHPALLDGIAGEWPDVPLIGCTTAGEIATSGPGDDGVVVMTLGADGFSVATSAATGPADRLRQVSAPAAACPA